MLEFLQHHSTQLGHGDLVMTQDYSSYEWGDRPNGHTRSVCRVSGFVQNGVPGGNRLWKGCGQTGSCRSLVNSAVFIGSNPPAAVRGVRKSSRDVSGKRLCWSATGTWIPVLRSVREPNSSDTIIRGSLQVPEKSVLRPSGVALLREWKDFFRVRRHTPKISD